MRQSEQLQKIWKKVPFSVIGILLVLAIMMLFVWHSKANSWQSSPALIVDVYFAGEYQGSDGRWKPVEKDQHISATQGDVRLKGQFYLVAPDGEELGAAGAGTLLAFYMNHINITVQEQGMEPCILDVESDYAGKDMCGEYSLCYELMTDGPVELLFHNNHRLGNENAIDDFLREIAIYTGTTYEKEFMAQGDRERNTGLVFVIVALVLLGTALFSALLHVDGSSRLWLIGLSVLFAGGYFAFGAKGVFFWNDSVIENTLLLGICMMLYMLCMCTLSISVLDEKLRKVGAVAVALLGVACVGFTVVSMVTDIRFYDTWLWWAIAQSAVNAVLLVCLALGVLHASGSNLVANIGTVILLIGFEVDFVGTAFGWWQGGMVCKYTFAVLFVIAMVLAWQIIPRNVNAARKARAMEAEQKEIRAQLQESRIAVMISQIQPHFIYNTLGTIQHLCKENPEQAAMLVQNFSVYLRGNFSELDNTAPILFSKELEHVHCYTEIELVRFPDMTVHYDIQAGEFLLPALTVQPLVENAIKHGLMGLEEGGTITITAYETESHYCVKVVDDGVGFDVTTPQDPRKHVGIRNARERLQLMCGGSLSVESQPGKGTTAWIQIPKEGNKV